MEIEDHALKSQFQQLEKSKMFLIDLIHSLPPEKYRQQPVPQSWSIAQAVNHLFLCEKLLLAYQRKKISYPETLPKYHLKSWFAMYTYKVILSSFIKVKAPGPINMWENQEIMAPDELDEKWAAQRKELFDFLKQQYPQFKNHLVFRHPSGGRLNINHMLIFFNDHILHHTRQVKRILKEIS